MRAAELNEAKQTPIVDFNNGFKPLFTGFGTGKYVDRVQTAPRLIFANKSKYEPHASVSIQASSFHHCSPRKDMPWHLYDSFELGFPSDQPELLNQYGEYDSDMVTCSGVYNLVPKEIVQQYVDSQGGIIGYCEDPANTDFVPFELTDEEISYYILNNS